MQKKIKIGAIGIGRLGATHARNIAYHIPQAELIAVCSRTLSTAKSLQKELAVPYAYQSIDEMLENTELDAVCITSHTRFHSEHILKSLDAGLSVFCDKPIAEDYDICKVTCEEIRAKHADKICMIGYMKRYDPSYAYVKSQIDAGYLGQPILFRGYAVDSQKIMQQTLDFLGDSGGVFHDFFVHDFDLSRWLVGSNWVDDSIKAMGSAYLFREFEQYNDADNATCLAQFQNAAMAFYYCGRTAPHGYLMETEIVGTKAIYRIGASPSRRLVEVYDHSGKVVEEHPMFLDRFKDAYLLEMQEFVNCVVENRQPENTIYDALESTRMAQLASLSYQRGKER